MYKITDIPIGAKNAISRRDLALLWNVNDRMVRRIIADMRTVDDGRGYVIVSVSRGRGYYRSNDPAEIDRFISEMQSRIRGTYKAIKAAKKIADRHKALAQHGGRLAG